MRNAEWTGDVRFQRAGSGIRRRHDPFRIPNSAFRISRRRQMTAMAKTISRLALVAALASTGACVDLSVTNVDAPDRERALSEPGDVEALISGTFRTWWNLQQGNAPGPAMSSM